MFDNFNCAKPSYALFCERLQLQTAVVTEQPLHQTPLAFVRCLREATHVLEDIVTTDDHLSRSLRPNLEKFSIISTNPVLNRPALGLICAAAISLISDWTSLSLTHIRRVPDIRKEPSLFWLIQAACYTGSQHLLDYLSEPPFASRYGINQAEIPLIASKCVATAIERGHQQVARRILEWENISLVDMTLYTCPFTAAIRASDVEIARCLVALEPASELQQKITVALRDNRTNPSSMEDFGEIFELLWPFTDRLQGLRQSMITDNVARIGSVRTIKYLALHKGLSAISSGHGRGGRALEYAAGNYHIECLRTLFENRYFENISTGGIKTAVRDAAQTALKRNHLPVFWELEHRYISLRHSNWFLHLAAAEGAVPSMKERLDRDPQLLDQHPGYTADYREAIYKPVPKMGHAALERASINLRYENVEFLLTLGVRLPVSTKIPWEVYVKRKDAFEETQWILQQYSAKLLVVVR